MSTMVAIQPRIEGLPEASPRAEAWTEVTPEELLAMSDGGHYELIDGELRERKVGALSNLIAFRVGKILGNHCDPLDLGWLFAAELGYQCFRWKPRQVRRADLTFIRRERYPLEEIVRDGFTTIAPDLAVEVVSLNDLASKDVEEKVDDFVRAGVKLVWVIYPVTRTVYVIRGDGTGYRLRSGDELTGEDVIPDFRCRVADLFPSPTTGEPAGPGPGVGPEAPR
jgi:Uma2 family endonuclease